MKARNKEFFEKFGKVVKQRFKAEIEDISAEDLLHVLEILVPKEYQFLIEILKYLIENKKLRNVDLASIAAKFCDRYEVQPEKGIEK